MAANGNTFSKGYQLSNSMTALSLGLGANDSLLITNATVTSTTGVKQLFSSEIQPNGGSPTPVDYQRGVPAQGSTGCGLSGQIVTPGGSISAQADVGSGVYLQISGILQ